MASITSQYRKHPSTSTAFLMSVLYFLALYSSPSREASPDYKMKLQRAAALMEALKQQCMMEAPRHSHAIMALDLICTYDPLSESMSASNISFKSHRIISATHKRRRAESEDASQQHARYGKARGEAMMSSNLCSHFRRSREASIGSTQEEVVQAASLLASVELNAMTLLDDCPLVGSGSTPYEVAGDGETYRLLGHRILQCRTDLQRSVMHAKEAFFKTRQRHIRSGLDDDEAYVGDIEAVARVAEDAIVKTVSESNRRECAGRKTMLVVAVLCGHSAIPDTTLHVSAFDLQEGRYSRLPSTGAMRSQMQTLHTGLPSLVVAVDQARGLRIAVAK
ncbi:hypothetical protein CBS101457_001321 [Exobasidium rhododendri]|nr:hypothetical protein CBS101457_001321 [Exobasidium rhododendri]